jgi:outer membrane lipoprotein-sorting protein
MHRRTLLALLATAAVLPASRALAANFTPEQAQLINDISAYNSGITTMAGRFLQVDTQGARIEGTFYLQRPGKIRFRYNPPSHEEIISVGRGFYVIDREERTQYAYPQDKVPLRQFLDSKIDLMSADIVGFSQSKGYTTVNLRDDTPAGRVEVALIFDTDSKDLVQWVLQDPSGTALTFSLYDVQKNIDIPKSYFYLDPTYTSRDPARG